MIQDILKNYQGLISAFVGGLIGIIGSVATIITTYLLRQGKLKTYLSVFKIKPLSQSSSGALVPATDTKLSLVEYHFELDFYNASEDPQSIRNIQIEFRLHNTNFLVLPYSKKGYSKSGFPMSEPIPIVNFPPRQFFHLTMDCVLQGENIKFFSNQTQISINAIKSNEKEYRFQIKDMLL